MLSQEEILSKLYTDLTRLAGEVAIDRCRTRVLMKLVMEKGGVTADELDGLFREELETNLEGFVKGITDPMLAEMRDVAEGRADAPAPDASGCCGGRG